MPLPARRILSAAIEPFVPHYDALLLANHGAVTCGPDLLTAFFRMETIEHFAKITLTAELAGEPTLLSSREVAKLMAARARYFVTPPPGRRRRASANQRRRRIRRRPVSLTRTELDALDRRSRPQRPRPPLAR